ncbi:hypothetical protein BpHYR1_009073 [Brachionus plicatilis]|uniref:Uncharacterized protein n=1 Tax=Brachionus plicatilis TaxID=10195 RepID=A0A3M7QNR5_BRAPC|nr:hypothetical protein BpHYR1_009073 [Brachionus plicatilis]
MFCHGVDVNLISHFDKLKCNETILISRDNLLRYSFDMTIQTFRILSEWFVKIGEKLHERLNLWGIEWKSKVFTNSLTQEYNSTILDSDYKNWE